MISHMMEGLGTLIVNPLVGGLKNKGWGPIIMKLLGAAMKMRMKWFMSWMRMSLRAGNLVMISHGNMMGWGPMILNPLGGACRCYW